MRSDKRLYFKNLFLSFLVVLLFLLIVAGCPADEVIALPSPRRSGKISLEEAIYNRRSVRDFKRSALSMGEVSQLLWAAGGKNIDGLTGASRSAPSAGGIYPVEIYLVVGRVKGLSRGIYKYSWRDHSLRLEKAGDHRAALAVAALHQEFIAQAPICLVLTAYYRKTESKYGKRGTLRYVPMDAGHAAQNVCLQAEALGLGAVPVGAFLDRGVEKVLNLKAEEPLYLLPVGRPLYD